MARKFAILTMVGLLLALTTCPAIAAGPPAMRGRALLLMDGLTGQILYQQNGTAMNYPASTTKLLTALVAVEHGRLDQRIRVSRAAIDKGWDSASCYISEGEEHPLEHLLYGLLLSSGNDCADAIAEGLTSGKPEQFMAWMNETAARVGATRSHFTNPHGLHAAGHRTTAFDLALIARAAMANPQVARIAGTREFVWPGKESNGTYRNHNAMLSYYEGMLGGKTGYTEEARHTLATVAVREGRSLVAVGMGYDRRTDLYSDLEALLDFGFESFVQEPAVVAGAAQGEVQVVEGRVPAVPVMAAASFPVSRPREGAARVQVIARLPADAKAPIAQGDQLGLLEIREGDRLLGVVPLVAQAAVEARSPWLFRLGRLAWLLLKWVAAFVAGLLLFRTVVRLVRRRLRRLRRASDGGDGRRSSITSVRTRSFQ